jgi:hypothetical protein
MTLDSMMFAACVDSIAVSNRCMALGLYCSEWPLEHVHDVWRSRRRKSSRRGVCVCALKIIFFWKNLQRFHCGKRGNALPDDKATIKFEILSLYIQNNFKFCQEIVLLKVQWDGRVEVLLNSFLTSVPGRGIHWTGEWVCHKYLSLREFEPRTAQPVV